MNNKFKFDGIIAAILAVAPFLDQIVALLPQGGKAALAVGALLKVASFLRHFVPKSPAAATASSDADVKSMGG